MQSPGYVGWQLFDFFHKAVICIALCASAMPAPLNMAASLTHNSVNALPFSGNPCFLCRCIGDGSVSGTAYELLHDSIFADSCFVQATGPDDFAVMQHGNSRGNPGRADQVVCNGYGCSLVVYAPAAPPDRR